MDYKLWNIELLRSVVEFKKNLLRLLLFLFSIPIFLPVCLFWEVGKGCAGIEC